MNRRSFLELTLSAALSGAAGVEAGTGLENGVDCVALFEAEGSGRLCSARRLARSIPTFRLSGGDLDRLWFGAIAPALRTRPSLRIFGCTSWATLRCVEIMAMDHRRVTVLRVEHRPGENETEHRLWMSADHVGPFESCLSAEDFRPDALVRLLAKTARDRFGTHRVAHQVRSRSGAQANSPAVSWVIAPLGMPSSFPT